MAQSATMLKDVSVDRGGGCQRVGRDARPQRLRLRRPRADGPGGCAGERPPPPPRYAGRHGFRVAPSPWRAGHRLCQGARRHAGLHGDRHRLPDQPGQRRPRQRHHGSCRRDRRFSSRRPLSSGLRDRRRRPCGRRDRRTERRQSPQGGHPRLRHRHALQPVDGSAQALRRRPLDAQRRAVVRRQRGGRRPDAVLARAGAPSPVLCRSAGLRRAVLGARRPAYREGFRFRRHDGAQRLVGRHHGRIRIHRRR